MRSAMCGSSPRTSREMRARRTGRRAAPCLPAPHPEPLITRPPMPERRGDSVFSEPAFNGSRDSCAGTDQEVWEEPTLQSPPPSTPGTSRAGLKAGWEHTPSSTRVSAFLGLIAVSGLVGIGCSLLQEWSQRALLAAIVFVPVIEELGKTLGPILVLER